VSPTGIDVVKMNALYYGDNLAILINPIPDGSSGLVFLDPQSELNHHCNILSGMDGYDG
jgi:hypothetical protein